MAGDEDEDRQQVQQDPMAANLMKKIGGHKSWMTRHYKAIQRLVDLVRRTPSPVTCAELARELDLLRVQHGHLVPLYERLGELARTEVGSLNCYSARAV